MRRKYSDREKAEALAAVKSNGGNIFRTSHELKIPWGTLAGWVKGTSGINRGVTELREEKEEELAIICERVARKYLAQAEDPWAILLTPGNLAMTTAAIAIDKNRLLLGQPTSIVSNLTAKLQRDFPDVAPEELQQYASELLQ